MLEAGAWGLLGASSLLVGALIGTRRRAIPTRALGLILGFGAGTLLSAVAFELTEDAYNLGGADAVAIGLAFGALGSSPAPLVSLWLVGEPLESEQATDVLRKERGRLTPICREGRTVTHPIQSPLRPDEPSTARVTRAFFGRRKPVRLSRNGEM